MPGSRIIATGAEAVLYLDGPGKVLVKERVRKGYRLPQLDEKIRQHRTRREARMLSKAAGSGISVPGVLDTGKSEIRMDFIGGRTVKECLNGLPGKKRGLVCRRIGEAVAALHRSGMVHGDLTTSNMILKDGEVYIVDFGLGKFSQKTEDQAVDMFLLYEALKAAHYKYLNDAWQNILKIYRHNYTGAAGVLKRFDKISVRRRYKQ
jgi:TP53 regulating kinase-like protein